MKIGFFGNTNNYPFSLAMALRELGHEVRLLINEVHPLHRPETRFPEVRSEYSTWIADVSPTYTYDAVFPTRKNRLVRALLKDCDALVLNSFGPSFARYFNVPTLVILTGSDLDLLANPEAIEKIRTTDAGSIRGRIRAMAKYKLYERLARYQRAGISKANAVEYSLPGMLPHGDVILDELGVPDFRRRCYLITDIARLQYRAQPNNPVPRLFSATRLNWRLPLPPGFSLMDYKGTDVLLRALAIFVRRSGQRVEIRLVRKGLDIDATVKLVEELQLTPFITWLDEMSQEQVFEEFAQADIVLDHFGDGSIGVAGRDAMAMGRPVIGNGKPEVFERGLGVRMPVAQARTVEELVQRLNELVFDSTAREQYGLKGRQFAERFFDARQAAKDALSALFGGAKR